MHIVFVASNALRTDKSSAFRGLLSDMDQDQLNSFKKNMSKRFPDLFEIVNIDEFRRLLIALVEGNIARLQSLVDEFESRGDLLAESTVAQLKCDQSPENYRLLNYLGRTRNGLLRGFASYEKYQKRQKNEQDRTPTRDREDYGPASRRPRANGGGMQEDVDLAWAYEESLGAASSSSGTEEMSPREMARLDVLLDEVFAGDEADWEALAASCSHVEDVDLAWAYEESDGAASSSSGTEEMSPSEVARLDVSLDTVLSGDEQDLGIPPLPRAIRRRARRCQGSTKNCASRRVMKRSSVPAKTSTA